jgi:hypothetical protein
MAVGSLYLASIIHELGIGPGIWPLRVQNVPARDPDGPESAITDAAGRLRGTRLRSEP